MYIVGQNEEKTSNEWRKIIDRYNRNPWKKY